MKYDQRENVLSTRIHGKIAKVREHEELIETNLLGAEIENTCSVIMTVLLCLDLF